VSVYPARNVDLPCEAPSLCLHSSSFVACALPSSVLLEFCCAYLGNPVRFLGLQLPLQVPRIFASALQEFNTTERDQKFNSQKRLTSTLLVLVPIACADVQTSVGGDCLLVCHLISTISL
jgi:hypothetical protein